MLRRIAFGAAARLRAIAIALSLTAAAPAVAMAGGSPDPSGVVMGDQRAVNVTVTVVHARTLEGGVAPELAKIEKYLVKSFPKYRSFARLSTHAQQLAVGAEAKLALPNNNELVYAHTGWKDGFAAIHLAVGGLDTTVNVKDGGTFFQAGRGYDGGMIVLAIQVDAVP